MKRLTKSLLLTTALVAAMSPAMRVFAATPDGLPLGYTVQDEMLSTSPEALATVAHVQAARLALMNENFESARDHIQNAIDALSVEEAMLADMDLSRICAAPSARLGHLAFECQGAFASQC